MPDLKETYGFKDKNPFGGFVAYNMLKASYPENNITHVKEDFAKNYNADFDTKSVYFNISRNYYVSDIDAESLLGFVYKGNTAFIASSNIDTNLLAKIYASQADTILPFTSGNPFRNASLNWVAAIDSAEKPFGYFYYPFSAHFPLINSTYARIVGYNEYKQVNCFVFFWGKGRLYLHCEPRAFSNYFLLTKDNYKSMRALLAVLPQDVEKIYWDDNYSKKNYRRNDNRNNNNNDNFSTFGTIMKYPALKRAFWITLFLLVLYILFNSKRRQRIVPVVKKPENTSIAFAEAIAGLYLNEKDNRLIAEKMITYFNEYLRTKYFITGQIQDPAYAETLSKKTGVSPETTAALAQAILSINTSAKVSDQQLLSLNGLIEKFYKNKV